MPKFEALIKDKFSLVVMLKENTSLDQEFNECVHQLDGKCSVYKLTEEKNQTFFEYMLINQYPTFLLYEKGVQKMRFHDQAVLKEVVGLIDAELKLKVAFKSISNN